MLDKAKKQNGVEGPQQALRELVSAAIGQGTSLAQKLGNVLWPLLKWTGDIYVMVWTLVFGMLWFVFSKFAGQQVA